MQRLSRDENGVAALELALVLPILLIMFAGIVDFGIIYWQQHVLTSAARQGARAASLYQSTANVEAVVTQYVRDAGIDTSDLVLPNYYGASPERYRLHERCHLE